MQHNFFFPKVASPSQCASLWRDVQHARVRWLCLQIFRTFQSCNMLWSRNIHKMSPIYSSSIWHKAFDPPPRAPATIWRNPQQQNQWPAHCSNLGPHPRHSSSKCGWRHENDFIVMGNVHKMAHDVRETIVNPHIREKLRQRRPIEH